MKLGKKTKAKAQDRDIECTKCGGAMGQIDLIPGLAMIDRVTAKGEIVFAGDTDVNWDEQNPIGDKPRFACKSCGTIYDSIHPEMHVADDQDDGFTVMSNVDLKWHCPKCMDISTVDYDSLVESGQPMCGHCDCDLERGLPEKK